MKQAFLFPPDPARNSTVKREMEQQVEDAYGLVTIDDMPNEDMRLVAEAIGVKMAVTLMKRMGGIVITIPKTGMKRIVKRLIRKQFNGGNAKRLAMRFDLSERYVLKIVNEEGADDE